MLNVSNIIGGQNMFHDEKKKQKKNIDSNFEQIASAISDHLRLFVEKIISINRSGICRYRQLDNTYFGGLINKSRS